jgi:hypothetical protein
MTERPLVFVESIGPSTVALEILAIHLEASEPASGVAFPDPRPALTAEHLGESLQ